jgi:Spy/CpxP family protein refolding chaperone
MTSGTRFATVAILGTVFVSGGLLGAALDRQLRPAADASTETSADSTEERSRRKLIVEEVGLSAEQKAQVDSIVALGRANIRALRQQYEDEYNPLYRRAVQETREAIKGVLTPEQVLEYDRLLEEHSERRRRSDPRDDGNSR